MHTIEIPELNEVLQLPQSLGECNEQQYKDMANYLFQLNNQQIDFYQFKLLSLYKLLGLSYTKNSKLSEGEKEEMNSNLYMLSSFIEDFFTKDEKGNIQGLKFDFLHNPAPKVKHKFSTYYGPSDVFQNITFGEYMEGLDYFTKFMNEQIQEKEELKELEKEKENLFQNKLPYPEFEKLLDEISERIEELKRVIYLENQRKPKYLRELFAVFYRKKQWFTRKIDNPQYDIRKPFNKYKVFQQSEKFVTLDPGILYGFFLYFFSFQSYLDQAQINVGGNDIDLSILFEKNPQEPKENIPGIGMLSVAFSLSQSQVFGDLEKVEKTNFWKVILHLYDLKKRSEDEKVRETNSNPTL